MWSIRNFAIVVLVCLVGLSNVQGTSTEDTTTPMETTTEAASTAGDTTSAGAASAATSAAGGATSAAAGGATSAAAGGATSAAAGGATTAAAGGATTAAAGGATTAAAGGATTAAAGATTAAAGAETSGAPATTAAPTTAPIIKETSRVVAVGFKFTQSWDTVKNQLAAFLDACKISMAAAMKISVSQIAQINATNGSIAVTAQVASGSSSDPSPAAAAANLAAAVSGGSMTVAVSGVSFAPDPASFVQAVVDTTMVCLACSGTSNCAATQAAGSTGTACSNGNLVCGTSTISNGTFQSTTRSCMELACTTDRQNQKTCTYANGIETCTACCLTDNCNTEAFPSTYSSASNVILTPVTVFIFSIIGFISVFV